ncbi:MAG TPA: ATP phosphoribosyltransferase [Xanthomonadales bacterium]|nr:ATP phosphoribosyltransferase [Xanthomonadales bacterium]
MSRARLRIAVQKSGRLAQPSRELLARCGLEFRAARDDLVCRADDAPVDLLLVRDDDVPAMIAAGDCDLGIVGRNVLAEQGDARVAERRALGFGRCRLAVALPRGVDYASPSCLAGLRIATSHPALLSAFLERNGVDARVVVLSGSVEIAPRLGTADAVCDLVSSGATLAANALREVATVLESEAVLAGPVDTVPGARGELATTIAQRIDGALAASRSRLVMLHAPRAAVARITQLLPGSPRTTVTPLDGDADDVAVQAVCRSAVTWAHLEAMQREGARELLVVPAEKLL